MYKVKVQVKINNVNKVEITYYARSSKRDDSALRPRDPVPTNVQVRLGDLRLAQNMSLTHPKQVSAHYHS